MKENLYVVVLIAHNQMELVKQQVKIHSLFASENGSIVIVDNYSDDGLGEWLKQQKDLDYIICDEGLETYSVILNTVIQEFVKEEDVLLLSPRYLLLPGCVENLYKELHGNTDVGAVCANAISHGSQLGKDFGNAVAYAQEHRNKEGTKQIMCLEEGAVMFRNDLLGGNKCFDEQLRLPRNILRDFVFDRICAGWKMLSIENAYIYEMPLVAENVYVRFFGETADRKRLKEKWSMNYFNDRPNVNLLSQIERGKEEEFSVLEIGCDCGANLLYLRNLYQNVRLYGVEINPMAANITSHIAKVQVTDIEKEFWQFDGVQFDYVIFGDVLEHLRNPGAVLGYCRENLKKGGRILASIPNLMHYSVLYQLINGDFTYADMGLLDRTHIHFFTYNEIVRLFEGENYTIEDIKPVGTGELTQTEKDFVGELMKISHRAQQFMFLTFQYIVSAGLK